MVGNDLVIGRVAEGVTKRKVAGAGEIFAQREAVPEIGIGPVEDRAKGEDEDEQVDPECDAAGKRLGAVTCGAVECAGIGSMPERVRASRTMRRVLGLWRWLLRKQEGVPRAAARFGVGPMPLPFGRGGIGSP